MTKQTKGLAVSQEGSDWKNAPDWQHVFDTRWRFMEVWDEFEAEVTVPFTEAAPDSDSFYWQKVEIKKHGLNFHPGFHGHKKVIAGSTDSFDERFLYVDDKRLMMAVEVGQSDKNEVTYKVKGIIYNLPILETYKAPVAPLDSYNLRPGKTGVRMLDGTRNGVGVTDRDPKGYAIDTTKRILSVHETGQRWIREHIQQRLKLETIDVSTDIFTYTKNREDDGVNYAWVETGAEIQTNSFPNGTYPSPLETGTKYYIIYISDTELQLAYTESDANNGNQIDITDSGDLPVEINRVTPEEEKDKQSKIFHDVGYPPSFLLAPVARADNIDDILLSPFKHVSFTPLFEATDDYIRLKGTQAVYSEEIGYVLLKDPVEVAE